ncbi:AcvB/VirJ family lysyl-phosphatidylglycerol hydrolase [Methylomonas sp. AM2-LC]|uniref:virulence factor family protein n=1 Tax=Methylomonas sp. AM2-LC TaxID=3153301 RepID=UPI0032669113
MKFKKRSLIYAFLSLISPVIIWAVYTHPPLMYKALGYNGLIAKPLWGAKASTLVFADTQKYPALTLGKRLAELGVTVFIVDSPRFLSDYNAASGQCLDSTHLNNAINTLLEPHAELIQPQHIISGISQGALLPFIHALNSKTDNTHVSIDFSVNLPEDLVLCPPLATQQQDKDLILKYQGSLNSNWLSVWADQPEDKTGVFVRALAKADTRIAAYDTPLDTLLVQQINILVNHTEEAATNMPVVEVPAATASDSVTIFYSGDGGWRDLDRTVAGEMAKQNYPVVGVDVLRYFWKQKPAEQVAADLSSTMHYYRQHWGSKKFILAGYSFGADIMPAVYNHLSAEDKDSVSLLVLLALAQTADFEIHVSGWLGQSGQGQPLAPELARIPKQKLLCVYGAEEKAETACTQLQNSEAHILELPGGHHFDEDYAKLTRLILDVYRQKGITTSIAAK